MKKTPLPAFVALCLLSACTTMPHPQKQPYEPKVAISVKNTVTPILDYARQFSGMSADMQKKELAHIQQKLTLNDGDQNTRITLALLYGLPANKTRDTAKSLTLFDKALQDKTLDPDLAAMATLFRDLIVDGNKLNDKLKEEQKQSATLQQKLEELKNIEKALGTRELPAGR